MDEGGQRWVLKALREIVNELVEEIYGLGSAVEEWRPSADEWSLREIVAHLHAYEKLAQTQIEHLISGRTMPLPLWDVESPRSDESVGTLSHQLRAFVRVRRQTTMLLWELMPDEWRRQGEHPYRGWVSVGQIARELAEHDLEHLWQIRRYKQTLYESEARSDG